MKNVPEVKVGIVAVSRDCFPKSLSEGRRKKVVESFKSKYKDNIYECDVIVENEVDMRKALAMINAEGCNALVVYLGNFGPETSETMLIKYFDGPSMVVACAEEKVDIDSRGDAYCGMLNASYNMYLRNLHAYIPENPVGDYEETADNIKDFIKIAKAVIAVKKLKVISFGPRPQDFLACNAPIKRLYDLGIEIEENSELDLFASFNAHKDDKRIPEVAKEMSNELGVGNKKPEILDKLAQYEITLLDWVEKHKGEREFVCIAGKCWPAFQTEFKFVPCYVNSRLAGKGIPVSCEVDIWGTVSEYIGEVISNDVVTILDINNTVPKALYDKEIKSAGQYKLNETFMGFHCGNTNSSKLKAPCMCNQQIMARALPAEFTNGTIEGDIISGNITFYRLQSTSDCKLKAYIAEGEVLPVPTGSFGSIGIFAIPEMGRFYRHVLIEKNFPHHGAVAFNHIGKELYEVFKLLGVNVNEIYYNHGKGDRYITENPFV